MVESRFLVGDTVRIQGDTRIWEVSDIGYSERMKISIPPPLAGRDP